MNNNHKVLIVICIIVALCIWYNYKKSHLVLVSVSGSQILSSTFPKNPVMNNNGNSPAQTTGTIPAVSPNLKPMPTLINPVPFIEGAVYNNTVFDNMRVLQTGGGLNTASNEYTYKDNSNVFSAYKSGDSLTTPLPIITGYLNPMSENTTPKVSPSNEFFKGKDTGDLYSMVADDHTDYEQTTFKDLYTGNDSVGTMLWTAK